MLDFVVDVEYKEAELIYLKQLYSPVCLLLSCPTQVIDYSQFELLEVAIQPGKRFRIRVEEVK